MCGIQGTRASGHTRFYGDCRHKVHVFHTSQQAPIKAYYSTSTGQKYDDMVLNTNKVNNGCN